MMTGHQGRKTSGPPITGSQWPTGPDVRRSWMSHRPRTMLSSILPVSHDS